MASSWDQGALVIEQAPLWIDQVAEGAPAPDPWSFLAAGEGVEDAENVGQWLANIGQGAASGAATGAVAGPWGALVGGLLGGGLGAVQTAVAQQQAQQQPQQQARPAPPPPRPAPTRPVPTPQGRPAPPVAPAPVPVAPVVRAPSGQDGQVLQQLAALVPVIASLAQQVGQLTQASTAAPAAVPPVETLHAPGEAALTESWDIETAATGRHGGWGESGEDAFDEGGWPTGEDVAHEDRYDVPDDEAAATSNREVAP